MGRIPNPTERYATDAREAVAYIEHLVRVLDSGSRVYANPRRKNIKVVVPELALQDLRRIRNLLADFADHMDKLADPVVRVAYIQNMTGSTANDPVEVGSSESVALDNIPPEYIKPVMDEESPVTWRELRLFLDASRGQTLPVRDRYSHHQARRQGTATPEDLAWEVYANSRREPVKGPFETWRDAEDRIRATRGRAEQRHAEYDE